MSEKREIAVAEVFGDVYTAVQDGAQTRIYDTDGDNVITFVAGRGENINNQTLYLIVLGYIIGVGHGTNAGREMARMEMRKALGLL